MTELICNQGHVIDPGRANCARCGGVAIGTAEGAPITVASAVAENEEVKARGEEEVKEEALDVDSLKVTELHSELEALGIEFDSSDLKADLQKKLKKAIKAEAKAEADAQADFEDEDDL